jgi:hypothetical protein
MDATRDTRRGAHVILRRALAGYETASLCREQPNLCVWSSRQNSSSVTVTPETFLNDMPCMRAGSAKSEFNSSQYRVRTRHGYRLVAKELWISMGASLALNSQQAISLSRPVSNTPPDRKIRRRAVYPYGISCEGFTLLVMETKTGIDQLHFSRKILNRGREGLQ